MTHAMTVGIDELIARTRAPRVSPDDMDEIAAAFSAIGTGRALAHADLTRLRARAMRGHYDVDDASLDDIERRMADVGDESGRTRTMFFRAFVLQITGHYDEARTVYERCLESFQRLHDLFFVAGTYTQIGMIANTTGDYPSALIEYGRALQLYQQIDDRIGIAGSKTNIGTVYLSVQDLDRAYLAYSEALTLHEANNDAKYLAATLNNLGVIHYYRHEFDRTIELMHRVLDLRQQLQDPIGVVETKGSLAEIYVAAGMFEEAREQFETFRVEDSPDPMFHVDMLVARARLSVHDADPSAARERYMRALDLAASHHLPNRQIDVYRALRDLAQQQNDLAAYIEYNTKIQELTERYIGTSTARQLTAIEKERELVERTQELDQHRSALHATLPGHIAERVVRGEQVNDHFTDAAVLFADIVGFTSHSSSMPTADVVAFLERVFSTFDASCERHHAIKVKTIGDSYMCFCADADATANACSVASVAVDVLQSSFTWPGGDPLLFRMGIHIGPVTAGVIGSQRLQYDVWGDTVNVASRLEGTSEPGRIHVSEAFATVLRSVSDPAPYSLTPRGMVEIKGKGAMQTFWLERTA
jgi:class 3 adenylate cyclase